jgi:hypothetical protein
MNTVFWVFCDEPLLVNPICVRMFHHQAEQLRMIFALVLFYIEYSNAYFGLKRG